MGPQSYPRESVPVQNYFTRTHLKVEYVASVEG